MARRLSAAPASLCGQHIRNNRSSIDGTYFVIFVLKRSIETPNIELLYVHGTTA